MAKAMLMAPYKSVSGKLAKAKYKILSLPDHNNFKKRQYFGGSYVNATEANILWLKDSHPYGNSAMQSAVRLAFKNAAAQLKTIWEDPAQKAVYVQSFKNQTRYSTLRGYIFAQVFVAPE
jgi:hypothetical protein